MDVANNWLCLSEARVIVAGAGGIGGACARALAEQGAHVLVVDRDPQRLDELLHDIHEELPTAHLEILVLDLSRSDAGPTVVAEALNRLGGVDALVHAVGVNDRRAILDFSAEEWERVLRVNLGTAFGIAQATGRHMVAQGRGKIVILSSVSGLLAHAHHGPYAASKGAVNQMVRVMAREWAPHGVTVNAVAPGYVETNLTAGHLADPEVRAALTALVPAGRLGTADEVAGPVLFLCSPHASFVTGHVLYVDGGRTLV